MEENVILTGDRTTGPLHIGHYAGSLANRVKLQDTHRQYLLLADMQAMTDNARNPAKVRAAVLEVALDYLAVGIDPQKTTICLQSHLPALSELSMLYLNFVTVAQLQHNPTIRDEIEARGFGESIPAGFLCYPAAQAADITAFKARYVPSGADQAPLIEQSNRLARKINKAAGRELLPAARALVSHAPRLPGPDGKAKMSKSQGNALPLSASPDDIRAFVKSMFTDPGHLRVNDPGCVEGNAVFTYLDAFDPDTDAVAEMKAHYARGGLGDRVIKARLEDLLIDLIAPIATRRAELAQDMDAVLAVVRDGTACADSLTRKTRDEVMEAIGMFRL